MGNSKGCSVCQPGEERYEYFMDGKKRYVQYDYRSYSGMLFSTVARSVTAARRKRDLVIGS